MPSFTILSQKLTGRTSPVSPISPTTKTLGNFISFDLALDIKANANPKSAKVPVKSNPPTTLTYTSQL